MALAGHGYGREWAQTWLELDMGTTWDQDWAFLEVGDWHGASAAGQGACAALAQRGRKRNLGEGGCRRKLKPIAGATWDQTPVRPGGRAWQGPQLIASATRGFDAAWG